jgi:hypothetical protein
MVFQTVFLFSLDKWRLKMQKYKTGARKRPLGENFVRIRCNLFHGIRRLHKRFNGTRQIGGRKNPRAPPYRFTVLKKNQGRHRHDVIIGSNHLVAIHVQFEYSGAVANAFFYIFENGRQHAARATPFGRKINKYRLVGTNHFRESHKFLFLCCKSAASLRAVVRTEKWICCTFQRTGHLGVLMNVTYLYDRGHPGGFVFRPTFDGQKTKTAAPCVKRLPYPMPNLCQALS